MNNRSLISIDFAGSSEEDFLLASIHEEKEDGASFSGIVKWPFSEKGEAEFDTWYEDIDLKQPPVEIGKKLFNLLFNDDFRNKIKEIFSTNLANNEVIIKIKVNDNALLSKVPFEILHDGNFFLFTFNKVFIRYINDRTEIFPTSTPLEKVLVILAEPNESKYNWGRNEFASKICDELEALNINFKIIQNATQVGVKAELEDSLKNDEKYSSIFIVAHGEAADGYYDGNLLLETSDGGVDKISSSSISSLINGHLGCFVFLCSCSSGHVTPTNPLASVGHHLIYNGHAGAVLSMQRPVTVDFGLSTLKSFIQSLHKGNNIFQAYKDSLTLQLSKPEHGVPCLYSRPMKTEKQKNPLAESGYYKEFNRIKSVFSLDIKKSKIALIFPGFLMGLKEDDYQKAKEEGWFNIPNGQYKYGRLTTAKADISAGKGIFALLGKIFKPEEIDERILLETDENTEALLSDSNITHYIFFGSYSHSYSRKILSQYSQDFEFNYSEDKWQFKDKRTDKTYEVPNPSKDENGTYDGNDYAIIEKIIDTNTSKVFFVIAGMWDTSTLAAGKYFLSKIDELYKTYGNGGFQIILSVKVGESTAKDVIVERRPLISK